MMRLRRIPEPALGISWSDITSIPGKLFNLPFQVACPILRNTPVLHQIVSRYGCSDQGRKLGTAALSVYATSQLGPAGPIVGAIGANVAIDCLCGSSKGAFDPNAPIVAPTPPPWYKSSVFWVGLSAAAIGTAAFLVKRKRSKSVAVSA